MLEAIDLRELTIDPFTAIGTDWMLITAGDAHHCNTMTASWGALGVLWNLPMATCYIRPQRYTKQFMDENEYFTLSFYDKKYRKELALCGSKSGRDVDKVRECGFTVARAQCGAPYFEQADLVLVCRKRYTQAMDAAAIPEDIRAAQYQGDYHTMYFGEIVQVLRRA